nr:wall-associated receptor kinase 2-like [Tanacetum cinerariifolium]
MMNNIAKPNCTTHCGNITVPYPFGIGREGCFLDTSFYLTCNNSYYPPKLFLEPSNHEIYNISDSELRIFTQVNYKCYNEDGSSVSNQDYSFGSNLSSATFTFSGKNKLTVIGCDDYAVIKGSNGSDDHYYNGCIGLCSQTLVIPDTQCSGKGCSQTSITKGLKNYNIELYSLKNHEEVLDFNPCGYAFIGEENSFLLHGLTDLSNASLVMERIESSVPVVIDWVIAPDQTCSNATECKDNSHCYNVDGGGYRCQCNIGYEGNPYLEQGCQDINECHDPRYNVSCHGHCTNELGSYTCVCPRGFDGNARKPNGCQRVATHTKFSTIIFTLGIILGTAMLILAIWIYKVVQKRKMKKSKERNFKRNGGLLVQQQTSNGEEAYKTTRLFSATELDKATDQYNSNRIVGRGGQGTVYKGMLTDGKIVAVKKSKLVEESLVEPFINEVFLLSQISHRNVVKLLGCCLETEVPILVYEFVTNGDLFQFIHDENYDFPTTWSMRLQIATEVAGALAYMHSATSIPIYHRDIKSSNILLDEKFRAKLSDFGISKSVIGDQTHLSTLVKGTFGYLDPEYFQTNQFTEKSDVYSFGVVLVELLTGKKPIYSIGPGESRSLATLILSTEEGHLSENVDYRVLGAPHEQLVAVAKLAKICLNMSGKLRPTMKEVEIPYKFCRVDDVCGSSICDQNRFILFEDGSRIQEPPRIEESHRGIASSSSDSVTKPQVFSFVAKSNTWTNNGIKRVDNNKKFGNSVNSSNNRGSNPNLHCINCGKVRHTIDKCFEIIGYPLDVDIAESHQ